jgi:hypothetical protein
MTAMYAHATTEQLRSLAEKTHDSFIEQLHAERMREDAQKLARKSRRALLKKEKAQRSTCGDV